jgi:RHS repeat-associated protein
MPHPMALPTEPIAPGGGSLGYLPGRGDVTPKGQFTYSIPIDVPIGRVGIEPRLSLQYLSGGANGILGVGWSVTGFSNITRCYKTLSSEGEVGGIRYQPSGAQSDHFCLDGKKLVVISGAYGENNAEYRTEQDSFSQVVSHTTDAALGPASFTVKLKNGLIRTYKPVSASRYAATKAAMSSLGLVYERWLLETEEDRSGNSLIFSYTTVDDGHFGVQYLPASINYTRHTSGLSPQRSVQFAYEDRPDVDFTWQGGVRASLKKRLRSITMSAPSPGNVQPVWIYRFTYTSSSFSNRSLLSSVQKCGLPGDTCTWKKEFDWYKASLGPTWTDKWIDVWPVSYRPTIPGMSPLILTLDADGDGVDDILLQRGISYSNPDVLLYTELNKGWAAAHPVGNSGSAFTIDTPLDYALPLDIDGDGTSEILISKGVISGVCDNKIVHWTGATFETALPGPFDNCPEGKRPGFFYDLDGDKRLDLITGPYPSQPNVWATSLNLGGSFESPPFHQTAIQRDPHTTVAVDFDGDGRVEIFGKDLNTGQSAIYGLASGSSWAEVLNTDGKYPLIAEPSSRAIHVLGDFNGDGLQDSIYYDPDATDHIDSGQVYGDLRWNTGNGFSPPIKVFLDELNPGRHEVSVRVADMNHDGRADLVIFHHKPVEGTAILISRGDGTFTPVPPGYDQPGLWLYPWQLLGGSSGYPEDPYSTSKIGDFNGDGFPDIIRLTDAVCTPEQKAPGDKDSISTLGFDCSEAWVYALLNRPHFADLLMSVKDEPTLWPRETIRYSTSWSDKPEHSTYCIYPKRCIKTGRIVVREVELRGHLVDPTNPTTAAHTIYYSYEDPVTDLRGRGFLGFRKFRIWDPQRPMETVFTFDNHAVWSGKGAYPYAMRPTMIRTVVPLVPVGGPPSRTNNRPITLAGARVVQVDAGDQVKILNGGLSYVDLPHTWTSKEWEQNVSIDWGVLEPEPLNPTSEHIFGISVPPKPLRTRTGSEVYDDYGSATTSTESTLSGASFQVSSTYDNLVSDWLIGLIRQRSVSTQEANQSNVTVTRTMNYDYDSNGRLSVIDRERNNLETSQHQTTTLTLDSYGVLTKIVTSVLGSPAIAARETRIEYAPLWPNQPDEHIFPSQTWQPFLQLPYRPSVWTAYHPAYGVLSAAMDVNGVSTQSIYDKLGRLTRFIPPGAPSVSVAYDGRPDSFGGLNGMVQRETIGGKEFRKISDGRGRPIKMSAKVFDGSVAYEDITYDVFGRVISVSRPYQGSQALYKTLWTYDPLDRPIKTLLPDTTGVTFQHTFFVSSSLDATGDRSSIERDANDRIVKSVSMLGAVPVVTTYEYEHFGLLSLITDDKGHRTMRAHDRLGREISESDPDAGQSLLVYDGFDEIVSKTHVESGEVTTYNHDDVGRLTARAGPDGTSVWTWDTQPNGIGKVAEVTSPDQVRSTLAYDGYGRSTGFTEEIAGKVYTVSGIYDPQGRIQELRYPSIDPSATPGLTLQYLYNSSDYLTEIRYAANGIPFSTLWQITSRNLDGRLLQGNFGNGLAASRTYFPEMGRLKDMQVKLGNSPVLDLSYGYLLNGLVSSRADKVVNRIESFRYDSLRRLKTWTTSYNAVVGITEYDYETDGNLVDVKFNSNIIEQNTYGQGGGIPHALTKQLVNGLASVDYLYDLHGRQTIGGGRHVEQYSALNLPKRVSQSGGVWTILYDAFGGRARKTSPSGETRYIGPLFEERIVGGQTNHVFHISGPDGGIAEISRVSTSSPLTVSYLLNDGLGSVSAIADVSGTVTKRLYFEPFGKRINPDNSMFSGAPENVRRGFTGDEHDYDLGLINMRGRVYDPSLKRMLTPDPLVSSPLDGQSWNPYSYVLNSPANLIDPTGFRDDKYEDCGAWDDNDTSGGGVCGGGGVVPDPQPQKPPPSDPPTTGDEEADGPSPRFAKGPTDSVAAAGAGRLGGGGASRGLGAHNGSLGSPLQSSGESYQESNECDGAAPVCIDDSPQPAVDPSQWRQAPRTPARRPMSSPDFTTGVPQPEGGVCQGESSGVWLCRAPTKLGITIFDEVSDALNLVDMGAHHWWVATESRAAGMGPTAGRMTELKDHSERVFNDCVMVPNADAGCVNARLSRIGESTGEWTLDGFSPVGERANTCQTLSQDIIASCGGPPNFDPWFKDPGLAWTFPRYAR